MPDTSKSNLRILSDANIPGIGELCAQLGEVRLFEPRSRTDIKEELASTDIFLCRSTVKVDRGLLAGSPVRFVATATSGIDHVDTRYLESSGIVFASAAGSNALSVAEYIFTALFHLAAKLDFSLPDLSIGIIGVGHVGAWVQHMAERIGMKTVLNDPPLREATGARMFRPLDEALAADIVTMHVPLESLGPHPTAGMIDESAFDRMRDGAIFINTSRGGVVDTAALQRALRGNKQRGLILDVSPHEPDVDPELVAAADVATPHIAGHSWDGKLLGAVMVYEALCSFLGEQPVKTFPELLPEVSLDIAVRRLPESPVELIRGILATALDVDADDAAMRRIAALPSFSRRRAFMDYRSSYRPRREFRAWRVDRGNLQPGIVKILDALGFS